MRAFGGFLCVKMQFRNRKMNKKADFAADSFIYGSSLACYDEADEKNIDFFAGPMAAALLHALDRTGGGRSRACGNARANERTDACGNARADERAGAGDGRRCADPVYDDLVPGHAGERLP